MSEIYWITILESINLTSGAIGILGLIIGVVLLIAYLIQKQEVVEGCFDYNREKKILDILKTTKNWSLSIGIIFTLIYMFTPTAKEAMMIWGVGSAIDYIKTNDKVQQLPDKCIDALDAWVESLNEKEK